MAPVRPTAPDPVVEAYKRDVDTTLLDRNLRLSPSERLAQLQQFVAFLAEARHAARGAPRVADAPAND